MGPGSSVSNDQPTSSTTNSGPQDMKLSESNKHKSHPALQNQKPTGISRQTLIVNTPSPRQQPNIPTTRTPMFIRATSVTAAGAPVGHMSSKPGRPIQVRPLQPSDLRVFKGAQIIRNPVQTSSMITKPPIAIPHGARHQVMAMNSPRIRTTTIIRCPQGRTPRPAAITSYQRHVMLASNSVNPLPSNAVIRGSLPNTVSVAVPIQSPPSSHAAYHMSSTASNPKHSNIRLVKSTIPQGQATQIRPAHILKPVGYLTPRSVGITPSSDPFMVIRSSGPPSKVTGNGVNSSQQIPVNVTPCTKPSTSTVILQVKERMKDLPHAIVKPQVLTHVIDGFIIEEASEPFPISRSAIVEDNVVEESCKTSNNGCVLIEEKKDDELLKCEFCGKMDTPNKFKRSKRFCSMACAKRYNVGCSKRLGLFKPKRLNVERLKHNMKMQKRAAPLKGVRVKHGRLAFNTQRLSKEKEVEQQHKPPQDCDDEEEEEEEEVEEMEKTEEPMFLDESSNSATLSEGAMSSCTPSEDTTSTTHRDVSPMSELEPPADSDKDDNDEPPPLPSQPSQWSPQHVSRFINTVPGCKDYANEFLAQEIDGQALMLLKEDHLMTAMSMKLGPALKIISKINSLKEK
ncbi:polyhomeotic-like protein 2 isoform X2 [Anneissia japonica]|uniref:polyhomeotic-like protein 2 isoform X2 n=1 Tax=Anneissia japonica TaxID=1529436 RepID=UPI00142591C2|nr:polyhomeotic-like protein 2 isoform X2 [Anneissia japonica]